MILRNWDNYCTLWQMMVRLMVPVFLASSSLCSRCVCTAFRSFFCIAAEREVVSTHGDVAKLLLKLQYSSVSAILCIVLNQHSLRSRIPLSVCGWMRLRRLNEESSCLILQNTAVVVDCVLEAVLLFGCCWRLYLCWRVWHWLQQLSWV